MRTSRIPAYKTAQLSEVSCKNQNPYKSLLNTSATYRCLVANAPATSEQILLVINGNTKNHVPRISTNMAEGSQPVEIALWLYFFVIIY